MLRFACKKFSMETLDIAQFGRYYVRGVGLPFVDSHWDLGILVDTELKFHGRIRSIVVKSFRMSVNLPNSMLCGSREFLLTHTPHMYKPRKIFIRVWFMCLVLGIYIGHEMTGKCSETMNKNKLMVLKIYHILKD